jgi:hypothetical protein
MKDAKDAVEDVLDDDALKLVIPLVYPSASLTFLVFFFFVFSPFVPCFFFIGLQVKGW